MSRPKLAQTGKRIQVYLAARHVDWWNAIPRYERSETIALALDLYREQSVRSSVRSEPHEAAQNVPKAQRTAKK